MYSFSYLEPVCCSMSSSNRCFRTCIQISQEAGQVVWYSHLFQNFPQFIVIYLPDFFLLRVPCIFLVYLNDSTWIYKEESNLDHWMKLSKGVVIWSWQRWKLSWNNVYERGNVAKNHTEHKTRPQSYFLSPSFSKPASHSSTPPFCNSRTSDFLIHSPVLYLSHCLKDMPWL